MRLKTGTVDFSISPTRKCPAICIAGLKPYIIVNTDLHLTDISCWMSEEPDCLSALYPGSLTSSTIQRIECGYAKNPETVSTIKQLQDKAGSISIPALSVVNPDSSDTSLISKCSSIGMQLSASESFSARYFGKSVRDRLQDIENVCEVTRTMDIPVRIYLHAAICCPYDGAILPQTIAGLIARLIRFGCAEFIQTDDCGSASTEELQSLINVLSAQTSTARLGFMFSDANPDLHDLIRSCKNSGVFRFCCSELPTSRFPLSETGMTLPDAALFVRHFSQDN